VIWRSSRLAIALAAIIVSYGCAPEDGATRYPLKGKIESLDILDRELVVAHEQIEGLMPAMTMPFKMPEATGFFARFQGTRIERLRRGDVIAATLVVKGNESWIERVSVVRCEPPPGMSAPVPKESKEGEKVVDVLLEDQEGKPLRISDYRGRVLILTFIYTRCPIPEFCPRMMKNFQDLENLIDADPDLREKGRLLSVSFDVEFDRPEVLEAFGSAFVKDRGQGRYDRWKLATGTKEQVGRLGQFFGLVFFQEGGDFTHSLATVVVGPDGKLVKEFSGNDWSVKDAHAAMRQAVGARSNPF
jgi:protein SCO1/2